MAICPKCGRNSLEHNYGRKVAWCLYLNDCGYEERVEDYQEFFKRFEIEKSSQPEKKDTCEA